jgi:hypothetical protein
MNVEIGAEAAVLLYGIFVAVCIAIQVQTKIWTCNERDKLSNRQLFIYKYRVGLYPHITFNAATHTREVSSTGGEAASSTREARKGRPGRPHPGAAAGADHEAADPAAGAVGESNSNGGKAKTRKWTIFDFLKIEKNKSARVSSL